MFGRTWRRATWASASIGLLSLQPLSAFAQVRFNLPAEPLAKAVKELAIQADLNIYYDPSAVAGIEARALTANLTPKAAFARLLSGTNLVVVFVDENTVRVVSKDAARNRRDPSAQGAGTKAGQAIQAVHRSHKGKSPARTAAADPATDERGGPTGRALEEVIVTAQKVAQRELDVPISLSVVGAEALARENVTSIDNLQFAVPGLTVEGNGIERLIEIRGISNYFGSGASVGEYIDEADATSEGGAAGAGYGTLDLRTYDLQRVEVLRGPQGTLYGEGSMGGTIRFIPNRPVLNDFQFDADVATLFTQGGAPSQHIEGVANTPLLSNILGLRFAVESDHDGGWIDQTAANVRDLNDQNLMDARVDGLWKPTQRLAVSVMQIIHRNSFGLNIGESADGDFSQQFGLTTTPRARDYYGLSNVTVTYTYSPVEVLSTTTYFNHDIDISDLGYSLPALKTSNALAPHIGVYLPSYHFQTENLSEELRIARSESGPWQWTVGGFYKRYTEIVPLAGGEFVGATATLPKPILTGYDLYNDGSKSEAVFGDASYELFDRVTFGAGGRYFKDDEFTASGGEQRATFRSTDPRFYVRYALTGNANLYASAAKGFRSGGFNGFNQPRYAPEQLWTYELGSKLSLFGRSVRIDVDVFLSNYRDYVVNGLIYVNGVLANDLSNNGSVRIKGIEGNVAWRVLAHWNIGVNADYTNGRFIAVNSVNAAFAVGDPVPFVPRYVAATYVEREFFWGGRHGFARLDYSRRASESFRNRANGPLYYGLSDTIDMLNANFGIQVYPSLRVNVFAQNLLNDRGVLDPVGWQGLAGRPRPRTYGLEFGVDFD